MSTKINKRDLKLFQMLFENGGLSTSQVKKALFLKAQINTLLKRLRKLESAGYVKKISHLSGYERIWTLTKKGAFEIGENRVLKRAFNPSTIKHDILLNELRFVLSELGAKKWLSDVQIRSQILSKKRVKLSSKKLIPDALFVMRDFYGVKRSVALELELTPKSTKRYGEIFRGYGDKSNLHFVWYVVATHTIGKKVLEVYEKKWFYRNTEKRLFYSLLEDVLKSPKESILYEEKGQKKTRFKDLFLLKETEEKPESDILACESELPTQWVGSKNEKSVSSYQNDLENLESEGGVLEQMQADPPHPRCE